MHCSGHLFSIELAVSPRRQFEEHAFAFVRGEFRRTKHRDVVERGQFVLQPAKRLPHTSPSANPFHRIAESLADPDAKSREAEIIPIDIQTHAILMGGASSGEHAIEVSRQTDSLPLLELELSRLHVHGVSLPSKINAVPSDRRVAGHLERGFPCFV